MLKLFNKAPLDTGKVVVLDEAHKVRAVVDHSVYMCALTSGIMMQYLSAETGTEGSKRLTDRLLAFTRQQRHLAMRIIIST
jgi:hypothetical protein